MRLPVLILFIAASVFTVRFANALQFQQKGTLNPSNQAGCDPVAASEEGTMDHTYLDPSLDAQIASFLNEINAVAGLAISVVHNNRVIYSRGFGYQDLASCIPVTPDTRFYLKSTTKSFLGVLAAQLHEEGAIELDAPITDYLPDLAPNGVNPDQLTLRDHLTHGIPYFDSGLNYKSAFVGMDEASYVQHINTYSRVMDTRFQYSNFGPIVAAHAMGKATGSNWRALIETKIFTPLGMTSSFTHMTKAEAGPMATAYIFDEAGQFEATQTKVDAQMHAAGGSVSTVNDLARWLIASLNAGMIEGKQTLSPRAFQQAHARQINMDRTYHKFRRFAHGFGHYSADYEGDLLMHHFGGETHVSFMPEHGFGVAMLSNQIDGGSITTHRVASLLYDTLLKKSDLETRWETAKKEIVEANAQMLSRKASLTRQLIASAPDADEKLPPATIAGVYQNDRIGDMTFSPEDEQMRMQYGVLQGKLDHIKGNAYLAHFAPWGGPPELFIFRRDDQTGKLLMDWGGRIFESD